MRREVEIRVVKVLRSFDGAKEFAAQARHFHKAVLTCAKDAFPRYLLIAPSHHSSIYVHTIRMVKDMQFFVVINLDPDGCNLHLMHKSIICHPSCFRQKLPEIH